MAHHSSRPGANFWQRAINGLDREFAYGYAAVQQLRFSTWSCNGWAIITDLLHMDMQLYNSFALQHEAATGGEFLNPIQ